MGHHIILDQATSILGMLANFIPGGKVLGAVKKSVKIVRKAGGGFTKQAIAGMRTYIRGQAKKFRKKVIKNLKRYVKKELKDALKELKSTVTEEIDEAIDAILLKEAIRETDIGQEFADLAAAVDPIG